MPTIEESEIEFRGRIYKWLREIDENDSSNCAVSNISFADVKRFVVKEFETLGKILDHRNREIAFKDKIIDNLYRETIRLKLGKECHVAHPGEGTLECRVESKCLSCERNHLKSLLRETLGVFDTIYGNKFVDSLSAEISLALKEEKEEEGEE